MRRQSHALSLFHIVVILAITAVLVGAVAWRLRSARRPRNSIRNVLLISIDTCRADRLGCYGYRSNTTPNIDALAKEGVLFENVISPIPTTLPAHSSMLTGTIPPHHGVHDNLEYQLTDSNVTLAEILKDHGFATAAVVSAFVLDSGFGIDQGFDSYNDQFDEDPGAAVAQRRGGEATRYATQWLTEHVVDQRFFLFLHYYDPHGPYDPPEPYGSQFADRLYDGEIAYTDHCIGQVIQTLKSLGLYESTLIIITSDHGEMLGEHGETNHSYFIYQSAIRVPLIFHVPGLAASKRFVGLTGLVDIVPTVCGLLKIESPSSVQGVDHSDAIAGEESTATERHVYCESLEPTKFDANSLLGLVSSRFKYIQTTRPELYDLQRDPQETRNVVDTKPLPARELQARLEQILADHARTDEQSSHQTMDAQAVQRIEGLGYMGGAVREVFEFDPSKDDPKDWIEFYETDRQVSDRMFHGQYQQARALCEKTVAMRPDFWGVHMNLAAIYQGLGDIENSIEHGHEAARLNPDSVKVRLGLATMLAKAGEFEPAITHFRKTLELDPENFDAHLQLGNALMSVEELSEAADHYKQASTIDPQHTAPLIRLGLIAREQGNLPVAIRYWRDAVEISPDDADANHLLAGMLASSGQVDGAIQHYRRAMQSQEDHLEARTELGNLLAGQGRFEEAVEQFQRVVQLDPDQFAAQYNLGLALQAQGALDRAATHLQKAIELNRDSPEAHNNLANVLMRLDRPSEAIDHYRLALELKPDHTSALINLGAALVGQKQFNESIVHYRMALVLRPEDLALHLKLGYVLETQGDAEAAIAHYRDGVELLPSAWQIRYRLANLLKTDRQVSAALAQYREAARHQPNAVPVFNSLAWILATHTDAGIRNPKEALQLAQHAAALTQHQNPAVLDTLAAAQAAVGQFEQAAETADSALKLIDTSQSQISDQMKDEMRARLQLYLQGNPYVAP